MMRTLAARACLLVATILPASAAAQAPAAEPTGIEVGARAGYGQVFGKRMTGEPFNQTIHSELALIIDLGYRLTPNLYVGGLLSYARLDLDKHHLFCNTEVLDGFGDCSGSMIRIGLNVQLRMPIGDGYAGWMGAGLGVERMAIDFDGSFCGPFSRVDTGVELGNVEAGAGMRVKGGLVIGPFASVALGMFRTSTTTGGCKGGGEIPDKTVHGTMMAGVRAMYALP